MNELIEKAKRFLNRRRIAYKMTFSGVNSEYVLADLAKFCRADKTCFHPDPRIHAVMEGRREVFLRIQHHLNLSEDELLKIYTRKEQND